MTVTGVDDADDDDDQTVSVSVAINTGSTADSFYDVVGSQSVNVTVVEMRWYR